MGVIVKVLKLREGGHVPARMTGGAAGYDLFYSGDKDLVLGAGMVVLVPTGVALEIPAGYEGQIRPRSGLALNHGITVLNAPGTVDADYRGEVGVILANFGGKPFTVTPGDRVAQLVIACTTPCELIQVGALAPSIRAAGGFGSTG